MNLNNIKYIFSKELRSFFNAPVAYIISIVYLAILGFFFTSELFLANISTLRAVFDWTRWILLFFAPAITMRMVSEEKKSGTLELLMTKPIREHEIIVGKFLAAVGLYLFTLLPTISYYVTVASIGKLDVGPVLGGYLGLLLLGAVYLAIGVLCSSATENQVVAFIVSLFIISGLFLLDKVLFFLPTALASVLEYISIDYHFSNIARGVIDTRDVIYYLSMISFSLLLGTFMLQKKRW